MGRLPIKATVGSPKATLGRQKIAIERISKKNHRQVTFSKRRSGLFKKASELCTLCGVEIAIVVFSLADKVFSFGHPNVETIIDRFLTQTRTQVPPPRDTGNGVQRLVDAHRNVGANNLNVQLTQVMAQLAAEKERRGTLDEVRKAGRSQFWWDAPVEELGLGELEQLRFHLEDLKRNVMNQVNRLFLESMSSTPLPSSAGPFGRVDYSYNDTTYETKPFELSHVVAMSGIHNFDYGYGHGPF